MILEYALNLWPTVYPQPPATTDMWQHKTGMRQYDNSPIINSILDYLGENFSYKNIVDQFYDMAWNIETCQGVWLDIWGRKVGISRLVQVPSSDYFGFNGGIGQPFNSAPFYNGDVSGVAYWIEDAPYRLMILAKAFLNITDCTIPDINKMLKIMFNGRGRCFVSDLFNMQMVYEFYFTLAPWELSIMLYGQILPRPSGVKAFLIDNIDYGSGFFGFNGGVGQPFNSAPLYSGQIYNVT